MDKIVYVDNAATTPISKKVYNAMVPYLTEIYGNASSLHSLGRSAYVKLAEARKIISNCLGASSPDEIIITGGGSEADNLAIKGVMLSRASKGKKHIITTKIEHPAVIQTIKYLESTGFKVTYLDVDKDGLVSVQDVSDAITDDTALISIMAANNEIGTVMPICEIGSICRQRGVLFHVDAVQAIGHIKINVQEMNIDLLSISGHKIHGPKGVGALYCKKSIVLTPIIHGGGHENGRRSGTENLAGIIGLSAAISDVTENMLSNMKHVNTLSKRLIEGLSLIPYSHLTGHEHNRLPGIVSFVFECIEGEGLLLHLDLNGICASTGSACSTGSLDPSHVLMAIGLPHEIAHGSLRLSLSTQNTMQEIEYIIEKVTEVVAKLRIMSPLWEEKMKEISYVQ